MSGQGPSLLEGTQPNPEVTGGREASGRVVRGWARGAVQVARTHKGLVAFVVLLLTSSTVMVKQSEPRVVGDGGEYVAMAWQISHLRPPSFSPEDMEQYDRHITAQPGQDYYRFGEEECCIARDPRFLADGRYDLAHFWLYPLVAAPFELAGRAIGVHDTLAFAGFHLLLLMLVGVAVYRRAGPWIAAVVVISPMLWWLDKPHTEIFVFSSIVFALCWRRERPALGAIAIAFAGSQNLALAPMLPLYVLSVLLERGRSWITVRSVLSVAAAGALVALHPAYYLLRLGIIDPQSRLPDQQFRIPGLVKLFTPVVDPYLGLLVWWPALVVLAVLLAVVLLERVGDRRERLERARVLAGACVALMALVALFGAAQNLNSNHGASFGMSRYGTWVAPFVVPLAIAFHRRAGSTERALLGVLAAASVVLSIVVAHPGRGETPGIFRPTYASAFLFHYAPGLYNPLPEVFVEREAAVATDDKNAVPAATADCWKVLLYRGQWPDRCPRPERIPEACLQSRFCYANRSLNGERYRYAPVKDLT